jgi:CRISPR-associated endonuclease Csy4
MSSLTHYLDLKAIPQTEMTQTMVINHLMQSLHGVLPAFGGKLGVGFPAYGQQNTLGGIIRIFGNASDISKVRQTIQSSPSFRDYAFMTEIQTVPERVNGYICYSRVRQKGQSALRRAEKRLSAQGKWNESACQNMINKWGSVHLTLPHICLTSKSNGQSFMLWIKRRRVSQFVEGGFNSYGLSCGGVVPSF